MKKQSGKKLVEILAAELKEWPECKYLTQDKDSKVYGWSGKPEFGRDQWLVSLMDDVIVWRPVSIDLAADYATAIVTRDQWGAERAKLSKREAVELPDMSDWRNWRKGDMVEIIDDGGWRNPVGSVYAIQHKDNSVMPFLVNGIWYRPKMLKFHSRPTK